MRAPIYFYVSQYHAGTRHFAVPVHLVSGVGPWQNVRALAGRRAGEIFSIATSELHSSPGDAQLVAGSREAIEKYGLRELPEAEAARALRKRIGSRVLTARQMQNAFDRAVEIAASARPKTPRDRAWQYFDEDVEAWRSDARRREGWRLVRMIDMVRGAVERYRPPPIDESSAAYARAIAAQRHAEDLASYAYRGVMQGQPEISDLPAWREVVDAYEIAEDAWREIGDEDHAERANELRTKILESIRASYGPRRVESMESARRRRRR